MKFLKLWCIFCLCAIDIQAATHWAVTEGGFIEPRLDSPFQMARPNDLLAFLNQDTRWENIYNLHKELTIRQNVIQKLWSTIEVQTDLARHMTKDENCLAAGNPSLLDWYASSLEDGRVKIAEKEYMLYKPAFNADTDIPDCKKISSLTFSMVSFDHIEGIAKRENLTVDAEMTVPDLVSPIMTVDQFGHWLTAVLKRNSSSWLHYNLASLYWRVRGNAPKAIECSRRAVHYAPREYKDVALLSMGSTLHRSKMTEDAITVLGAAIDHDPKHPVSHFVLGNAYAIIGEYNTSLKHYDSSLKVQRDFELSTKHKHGVLCHMSLMNNLRNVNVTLTKLRSELSDFNVREALWIRSQAAFLRTMKHEEEFDFKNVDKNCQKMSELTGLDVKAMKREGDKNSLIQYFLDGPMYNEKWLTQNGVHAVEWAYELQRLVKHISKHANLGTYVQQDIELLEPDAIKQEIGPMPTFTNTFKGSPNIEANVKLKGDSPSVKTENVENMSEYEQGIILYPPTMKVSRNLEDFDNEPEWPSNRLCKETAPSFPPNVEAVFPTFLPFENKGIRLKSLLTDKIGVPLTEEHELPWHPPVCPHEKEAAAFTQKKANKNQVVGEVVDRGYLQQKLLEYVGDGRAARARHMQPAEIGQRIHTAMEMDLAPKWLIYTLSSLYWRVRKHNTNALHCLFAAKRVVPARVKDLVLTSLASVYLEGGHFDEALAYAEEAFRISLYEPATNFILSELNMLKKHRNTHMFHLKQVVRVDPTFMDGLARNLLVGWACILKQVNVMTELSMGEGETCTQVEPGVSMVCGKGGANCHMSSVHCYAHDPDGWL